MECARQRILLLLAWLLLPGASLAQDFEAVNFGQLQIQQDDHGENVRGSIGVRSPTEQVVQGFDAVFGEDEIEFFRTNARAKLLADQKLEVGFIINDQDLEGHRLPAYLILKQPLRAGNLAL